MLKSKKEKYCGFGLLALGFLLSAFSILSFAQEQFIYDAKGRRNPFIPLVTADGRVLKLDKEAGTETLSVEGIIYDEYGLSYAIVDGQVVKIGDKVRDLQVLKIDKNKIIFIREGETLKIELKKEEE